MKYQVIQHLKTKTKLLGMFGTTDEAKAFVAQLGTRFDGLAYIGNFPLFRSVPSGTETKQKTYSIQGYADCGVVCSLKTSDIQALTS